MKYLLIILLALVAALGQAQEIPTDIKAEYEKNILLEEINGVYIPEDVTDAMRVLDEMSSDESKAKIKGGDRALVVRNLSRGLGKWMMVNWNLAAGSRLSHHLRGQGVSHPEDMALYIVETYYLHLTGQDSDLERRAKEMYDRRRKAQEEENKKRVIRDTTKS